MVWRVALLPKVVAGPKLPERLSVQFHEKLVGLRA